MCGVVSNYDDGNFGWVMFGTFDWPAYCLLKIGME